MQPAEFRTLLQQTIEDQNASRSERRALSTILNEVNPSRAMLDHYRHEAFDVAREAAQGAVAVGPIFNWLEDIVRLLTPVEEGGTLEIPEAHFSPGDYCRNRIRSLIRQARSTVDICVFTITDDEITEMIAEAHNRRVKVRIITDNDKANDLGSDIQRLEELGVPVRYDRTPYHMHHKFAIFDQAVLLTGSYNWTRSAALNNEENIVVQSEQNLLQSFGQVFSDLWDQYR